MIPLCSPKEATLPTALALGSFDGLHAGHREVINSITKSKQEVPTVVSFWPHPREVLYGESKLRLDLPSEKTFLLEPLGIKQLVLVPFDLELAALDAKTFVHEILLKTLRAKSIAVGENFRFGRNREGDISTLLAIGKYEGIEINIIPIIEDSEGRMSSSRIREALKEGELKTAQMLLGRPYNFRGIVVKGKGLGKKLGWPTANLQINGRKFLPGLGVYAAWAWQEKSNIKMPAIMNLGPQPTIDPTSPSTVEVHLLDRKMDLIGQTLIIEPVKRLRSQNQFENVQALCNQISSDAKTARLILNEGTNQSNQEMTE